MGHAYRDLLRSVASVRDGVLQRRVWYSDPVEEDGQPGGNEDNLAKFHFQGRMDLKDSSQVDHKALLHIGNPDTQYFLCGSSGWQNQMVSDLTGLGVETRQVHFESFGGD